MKKIGGSFLQYCRSWWADVLFVIKNTDCGEPCGQRAISLHTNKRDFKKTLSLQSEDTTCILLLVQWAVVWKAEGEYTRMKFDHLRREVERRLADRKG